MKKNPIPLRIISVILLLMWMGLISFFSAQTSIESEAVSTGLIKSVIKFLMPSISPEVLKNIVAVSSFFIRKCAHFSIFAILGVFSFLSVVTYEKLYLFSRFFISSYICTVYAVLDEYHQTFISGRSGELRDVLIDSAGAFFGIIFCLIIYSVRVSKMKKKDYIEFIEELQRLLQNEQLKTEELQNEKKELLDELDALIVESFCLREKLSEFDQTLKTSPLEIVADKTVIDIKKENRDVEDNHEVEEKTAVERKPDIEIRPDVEEKTIIAEPMLSSEVIDGAKIIGKIVLSSAEYCNKLTTLGSNPAIKELINLILGRTEVAKAEILRISSLQIDPQEKKIAMELEMNEAEDYFKSVMAQK